MRSSSGPADSIALAQVHGRDRIRAPTRAPRPGAKRRGGRREGPQGDTGPQGEQGIQGPTGPRGPSDAYDGFKFPGNNTPITGTNAARTRVLTFNIPAGSFAVTSKVNLSGGSTTSLVHCVTQTQTGYFDMGVSSIGTNGGETREDTQSTTFTAIESSPGPLTIDCWRINGIGDPPIAGLAEAVAIQVAHTQLFGF